MIEKIFFGVMAIIFGFITYDAFQGSHGAQLTVAIILGVWYFRINTER